MPELNLIDEAKLQAAADEVIERAIDGVQQRVIPALQAAVASQVSAAITHGADLLIGAANGLATLLAAQDGWTLTIGPTTIRLNKPEKAASGQQSAISKEAGPRGLPEASRLKLKADG
jgi:hypothetical protein